MARLNKARRREKAELGQGGPTEVDTQRTILFFGKSFVFLQCKPLDFPLQDFHESL